MFRPLFTGRFSSHDRERFIVEYDDVAMARVTILAQHAPNVDSFDKLPGNGWNFAIDHAIIPLSQVAGWLETRRDW
jgi:hypothetical protein